MKKNDLKNVTSSSYFSLKSGEKKKKRKKTYTDKFIDKKKNIR